jgi:hypothetical protein
VIHHLECDRSPRREFLGLVHHAHPTSPDALHHAITVNVLSSEAVVSPTSQAFGDDLRQHHLKIGMAVGQVTKIDGGKHERAHEVTSDDIGGSRFVDDQAHLTDDVAQAEFANWG